MNANKLHIDTADEPTYTVDTRHSLEDVKNFATRRRIVGAAALLAASAATAVGAGEIHSHVANNDTETTVTQKYTVEDGDTVSGIAQEVCGVDPADIPKVIFNLDEANPDLVNGNNQVSAGQKIIIPQNMCDISAK